MMRQVKRLSGLVLTPVLLVLASAAFAAGGDAGDTPFWLNMPEGVTEVSQEAYRLHMLIVAICGVIAVVVFGVMGYAMIAHRKSLGRKPDTWHESTALEILWTIVPFIILILMAIPATTALVRAYDNSEPDMDIMVTGYQWKWKYEYLSEDGNNVGFFSNLRTPREEIRNTAPKGEHYLLEVDEPLVIPVNKKVRFLITANDVIHSWWVPALAVKKDAIPGFVNEAWTRVEEPGIYRGQCAELCGKDHGFMPIVVRAVEQSEYDAWLADKQAEAAAVQALMDQEMTLDELMARGKNVYDTSCASCHGGDGEGTPIAPAMAGSAIARGPLEGHLEIVVNGKPGTAMAAFGSQLNEVDLAAVITYERNAWGNNMGDTVQPIDVANFKAAE